MAFLLTPSQERTLDLSTHLSVTANAGAGKTSVLARRFVEIFARTDAALTEVVAITFTEQAAGELRRRIHDVILERETAPGTGRAERLRLLNLRTQLASAVIGTIHSFCARILRMYPAEADVDASFGMVEGQERSRLIAESIAETFSESMGRGDSTGPSAGFRELLRAVPPGRLERFLERMFSQREQLHRLFSRRDRGEHGGGEAAIAAAVALRALESGWTENAREAALAAGGRDAAALLAILGGAGEAPPGPERMAEILAAADGLVFTKDAAFRKSFLGTIPAGAIPRHSAEYLREFETRYAGILRSLRAGGSGDAARTYDRLSGVIEGLFTAAQERYRVKKDDLGVLDFEDLQIMTLGLLAREEVRRRLQADYRFFLVDEFQDTNDLQYGILKGLLGEYRRGNLFIVGDPKQSIYGFRNADVGVFYDARSEITAELLRSGAGAADGGSVILEESFRPLPAIAAFVNTVFSSLMKRGGSRFEVDYNRIVVGRSPSGEGSVEMLLVPDGQAADRAGAVRAEAGLVAERLREIAGAGRPAYSFGECAVLIRDRTNLPALEKAFEEADIPYLLAGGVGFFQTQEVYDFLNYLRFLVAPDDDPALAGILRSPFFGLTDADLYDIARFTAASGGAGRPEGGLPLSGKLRLQAAAPGSGERIRRAERILAAHRAIAGRIPVPRLLRRIASDTGWIGTMAGLSHGPQHRENFLKLLELARNSGAAGPMSLYDFTVYLDGRAEEEEREGQAATASTGKAVRVMTIHAAKGLEFPVVFLPFLDRAPRADREPIIDAGFGIGFRPGGEEERDEGTPPRYAFLRALSDEKRIAEEKRILYVGCTRAKDVLVLSAAEKEKTPANSPLGWLRGVVESHGAAEKDSAFDFGERMVTFLEREGGKQQYHEKSVRLRVPVRRPGGGEVSLPGAAAPASIRGTAPRILIAPVTDTTGGEVYSATRLAAYATCPALYYLRYVLGAAPGATGRPGGDGEPDDVRRPAGTAALEGELTHLVLSELRAPVRGESLPGRISEIAASLGAGADSPALVERAARHLGAFVASRAGRAILAGKDARTEFQISALAGDAVVMGKIDRLFRGEDGLMEFVDYKTDAVSAVEAASRAEAHKPQAAVYAYLVSRLYAQDTVRGTILFLREPDVPVVFSFGPAELQSIERTLRAAIDAIRMCRFAPVDPPCAGCPSAGADRCSVVPALP